MLLAQGKVKVREIPLKTINYSLDFSKLFRQIKRNRFVISDVIFRPVEPNDKPRYDEFIHNYFSKETLPEEDMVSIPEYGTDSLYHVAVYQNKIIGGVGIRKTSSNPIAIWQISGLSVLPHLRGYGIGERLLKTAISIIKEENFIIYLDVFKDNRRAIKLYEKLGFDVPNEQEKNKLKNVTYIPDKLIMVLDR